MKGGDGCLYFIVVPKGQSHNARFPQWIIWSTLYLGFLYIVFLLEFKYGEVIGVEMYNRSSKVCVVGWSGWWERRVAEIRQESIYFLLVSIPLLCPTLRGVLQAGTFSFPIKVSLCLPFFPFGAKLRVNFPLRSLYPCGCEEVVMLELKFGKGRATQVLAPLIAALEPAAVSRQTD